MVRNYDATDASSIYNFSRRLIHKTLAQVVPTLDQSVRLEDLQREGKGGLGVLVEKYFFGYEPNNSPEADFPEAGVELKVSPLKKTAKGELAIKERMVCDMIDYMAIVHEEFEDSRFFKKSAIILILFYLHLSGYDKKDLEFLYSVLWKIKGKDFYIIQRDFLTIREKVRQGKAHEISEGDTMYLGACRKGQKGDAPRAQPYSDIPANGRAFAFKTSYMKTILDFVKAQNSDMATNLTNNEIPGIELVSSDELMDRSFEEILQERFSLYLGKTVEEICSEIGIEFNPSNKGINATLVRNILHHGLVNEDNVEEIKKAGIKIKTIRLSKTGRVKEHMSFENIDFQEVYECDNWIDSKWYEIITTRYMFVIFREVENDSEINPTHPEYVLDRMFFWTMPTCDYNLAEEYWNNIHENVKNNTLQNDNNTFWKIKDHKCFHVRPKARNSKDVTHSPVTGEEIPKKCYWFDNRYLMKEIKNAYGLDWERLFKKVDK